MGGFPPGADIHHSAGPKCQRFFLRKRRPRFLIHARRGRKKTRFFFAGRAVFRRPGGHTDPPPGTAAGHTFRLCSAKARRAAHFSALLWKSPPGHRTFRLCSGEVRAGGASPLCREEVRRAAHFSTLLWRSCRAGRCAQPPGRGVPGEGVVRSLGVPGGDRAPLTREFPTNSGVGVLATRTSKKPPRRTA